MPGLLIRGGDLLWEKEIERGADLRIASGRVDAHGKSLKPGDGDEILEAAGCWVLPGLVEIHSHGMKDVWVDRDDIHRYAAHQTSCGVTSCLPTLAASPAQDIARMKAILAETHDFTLTPNLVGFRPEIMYLSYASGGPTESLALPEPVTTEAVWEASGGRIRIWDISPEIPGALPFIEWCAEHGVTSSMAHSNATIEQVRDAVAAGLRLVTHFYDLYPQPAEIDEGVYPAGVTDYINLEDKLTAEIIPDGVHVPPLLVRLTLRCKGITGTAFITDSLKGSGMPPGRYEGLIPGEPIEVTKDRGLRRISDDILSGSAISQIEGFRNAVQKFGMTVPQASMLCSATPARVAGMKQKGTIARGMDGDVIVLDDKLALRAVVQGGKIAWRNG